jgi:hypothetical protein
MDSDKDGFTNGQELGDPNCTVSPLLSRQPQIIDSVEFVHTVVTTVALHDDLCCIGKALFKYLNYINVGTLNGLPCSGSRRTPSRMCGSVAVSTLAGAMPLARWSSCRMVADMSG